jgi:hypothetical protein
MILDTNFTCPFCFALFSALDIHFCCIEPRCTGWTEDTIYARARSILPVRKGHVFGVEKTNNGKMPGIPRSARCPVCLMMSNTRLCPECHFELSHDIGQVRQRIIAIVGARNTGKSHYIASVISSLRNEIGDNFKLAMRMLGDETQIRWEQDFYRPLFERKTVLPGTRPAQIDARVKAPLVIRLTSNSGPWKQALNISLFDSAGEDMTASNTLAVQARYITHADGIIFMIDPLQLDSVCQQLFNSPATGVDPQAHPERILERILDLFELKHGPHLLSRFGLMHKINVPVAFTLSKVDMLVPIIDPGSPLKRASEHHGAVDLTDIQSISTEVSSYLHRWMGSKNFCDNIQHNFSNFQYFGVSSLGYQPDDKNPVVTNPLRVEDPLLWLLYKMNFIRGKKIK